MLTEETLNANTIWVMVVVVVLTIALLVLLFFLLLVVNSNRKNKHQADLADFQRKLDLEVMQAEREATQNTMSEIGRELHDNVNQLLTAAQLGIKLEFEGKLQDHPPIQEVVKTLDQGIEEIGRLGRSLTDDYWQEKSFYKVIGVEAERIERMGLAKVKMNAYNGPSDLNSDEKTMLFRIFQEVMANALKHSRSDEITIEIRSQPFLLAIHDHGRGFDPKRVVNGGGLNNIARRCELIQFDGHCHATDGKGCSWTFQRKTKIDV